MGFGRDSGSSETVMFDRSNKGGFGGWGWWADLKKDE